MRAVGWLGVLILALSLGLVLPDTTLAQQCIRTGCEPGERDARGCCPQRATPPNGGGGDTGGGRRPPPQTQTCVTGQIQNADTENHCCWPSQVWSRERRACIGRPQCPSDRRAADTQCLCPDGMTDSGDARGHCCWPGQVFVPSRNECVGAPTCPPRFAASGSSCVAPPASCTDGMEQSARTSFQCCWPGQTWDAARGQCTGTIGCPSGWARAGNRCVQNPRSCPTGQAASSSSSGMCCWPGQTWDGERGACAGTPRCETNGWARAGNRCIPPVTGCEAGRAASAATHNQCCWPGQGWDPDRGECAGTPTCGEGWTVARNTCQPHATACPDGQTVDEQTRGQCCWPGQAWSPTNGACEGVPTCLRGWARAGMACIPPPGGCEDGRLASAQTAGQCCWAGQSWDPEQGQCAGAPRCAADQWTDGLGCHPLAASCRDGQISNQETRGLCCWPGQRGVPSGGGVAPAAADHDLIVGARYAGDTSSGYDSVTPPCGSVEGNPDERWTFTPSVSASYVITVDSSYDGLLAVYDGGSNVACNDDFTGTRNSQVTVSLEAGHTYYVVVDGYANNAGGYNLIVQGPPGGGGGGGSEPLASADTSSVCVGRPTSCPRLAEVTDSGCDVYDRDAVARRAAGNREFTVMLRGEIGGGRADYFPGWGGTFFVGGSAEAWGTIPFIRQLDGSALVGPLFGGRISLHDSVDAPEDSYEVSLRSDGGMTYGPLGIGTSIRIDHLGNGSFSQTEGTFGFFIGFFHAGRMLNRGEEIGALVTFHWLPDIYDQNSLANIEAEAVISFGDVFSFTGRVRYDEQLGEFRNLLMGFFGAGVNLP